jgi:hypothetical protein
MARTTYRFINGELTQISRKHSDGRLAIISDNLDGILNPADGQRYDSKSQYYRAVKDAGCEIVGGGDYPSMAKPDDTKTIQRDIAEAYQQLRGY